MNNDNVNEIAKCLYDVMIDNKELVMSMIDKTGSIHFGDGE